jgi:predicted CoA-substrate-specific enzyme activase
MGGRMAEMKMNEMNGKYFLGIDVGSISTNLVLLDADDNVVEGIYLRTEGRPIQAVKQGLTQIKEAVPDVHSEDIGGVGTTGSARQLSGIMVNADIIKDEITAHAVATIELIGPDVHTIFEIGGQDSKIIILREGVPVDFAMNTVCAAGTGSFLDNIAKRINIDISEFGPIAMESKAPAEIAGRCAVFAESDFVHALQVGLPMHDVLAGLCDALVRNYLNNVGKGKEILDPIVFQGGVSENIGVVEAFKRKLGHDVIIPEHNTIMGAVGSAMLAKRQTENGRRKSTFLGFEITDMEFASRSFRCDDCANLCQVICATREGVIQAVWGDKCGKYTENHLLAEGKLGVGKH